MSSGAWDPPINSLCSSSEIFWFVKIGFNPPTYVYMDPVAPSTRLSNLPSARLPAYAALKTYLSDSCASRSHFHFKEDHEGPLGRADGSRDVDRIASGTPRARHCCNGLEKMGLICVVEKLARWLELGFFTGCNATGLVCGVAWRAASPSLASAHRRTVRQMHSGPAQTLRISLARVDMTRPRRCRAASAWDRAGRLDVSAACIAFAAILSGVGALLNPRPVHDTAS